MQHQMGAAEVGTADTSVGEIWSRCLDVGMLCVEVVQEVLLYGSETWVMYPRIGRTLEGFHHRVSHRLRGRKKRRGMDGRWVYPPLEEVMLEARL